MSISRTVAEPLARQMEITQLERNVAESRFQFLAARGEILVRRIGRALAQCVYGNLITGQVEPDSEHLNSRLLHRPAYCDRLLRRRHTVGTQRQLSRNIRRFAVAVIVKGRNVPAIRHKYRDFLHAGCAECNRPALDGKVVSPSDRQHVVTPCRADLPGGIAAMCQLVDRGNEASLVLRHRHGVAITEWTLPVGLVVER